MDRCLTAGPGTWHRAGKLFLDNHDRGDFLRRVPALTDAGALAVYAWALMPNDFHLLVRTGSRPLPRSMRSLLTGYVGSFNRRHRRSGHLVHNRYKSVVCEEGPYFCTGVLHSPQSTPGTYNQKSARTGTVSVSWAYGAGWEGEVSVARYGSGLRTIWCQFARRAMEVRDFCGRRSLPGTPGGKVSSAGRCSIRVD